LQRLTKNVEEVAHTSIIRGGHREPRIQEPGRRMLVHLGPDSTGETIHPATLNATDQKADAEWRKPEA
jgi:hypothetical protein